MNPGFDPEEIAQLKSECAAENRSFVYVEDEYEEGDDVTDEHAHIQFVGSYHGKEVVYDAFIYTLRLHHAAQVYDLALERIKKQIPSYIPPEERADDDQDVDNDLLLTELIEEIEENEEIKVGEHMETDPDFDFGVGLEVGLNIEEVTEEAVAGFVRTFNDGTFKLDPGLYSFHSEDEDEDDDY